MDHLGVKQVLFSNVPFALRPVPENASGALGTTPVPFLVPMAPQPSPKRLRSLGNDSRPLSRPQMSHDARVRSITCDTDGSLPICPKLPRR